MLAVVQILPQRKVVKFVNCKTDFVNYIKEQNRDHLEVHLSYEGFGLNKTLLDNKYLMVDGDTIYYAQRTRTLDVGYIYNTEVVCDVLLGQWELIECDTIRNNPTIDIRPTLEIRPKKPASELKPLRVNTDANTRRNRNSNCNREQSVVQKFEPSNLKPGSKILIIGKRGCGKTRLIQKLLESLNTTQENETDRNVGDNVLIMPNGQYETQYYKELFPSAIVSVDVNNNFNLIDDKNIKFVVCDDICLKSDIEKVFLNKLDQNSRTLNQTIIYTTQYSSKLKHSERIMFDYVFCFKTIESNVKKLFMAVGDWAKNYQNFRQIYNVCTKDFGVLVIDNKSTEDAPFFWYKVTIKNTTTEPTTEPTTEQTTEQPTTAEQPTE